MTTLTNAEFVILGLLAERDSHAYELQKTLEEREMQAWARVSFPSLYRVAATLEKRGLLASTRHRVSARPPRRTFAITGAGRRALFARVEAILADIPPDRSLVALALMFAPSLPAGRVCRALRSLRENAGRRLRGLERKRREVGRRYPDPLIEAIFAHEAALVRAEQRWAGRLLAELEGRAAGG